ncbi:MAG: hypothetical protein ACI815_002167 [Psychroserpens sp.]
MNYLIPNLLLFSSSHGHGVYGVEQFLTIENG